MGRSQVERNRTRGRPGTKGGRGPSSSSNRPNNNTNTTSKSSSSRKKQNRHAENLGSNAFRYEKSKSNANDDQSGNDISSMMENLSSGNEFGLSHYSVASDLLYQNQKEDSNDPSSFINTNMTIDVKALSKMMEEDDSYEYLRFDVRMTELFLKRFANETGKRTVAESSRLCDNDDDDMGVKEDGDDGDDGNANANAAEGEEEDLEDFLDDLIGS